MKIKFNWGTGIAIALAVMIVGMTVLVLIAVRQDYDLVDKDYYQKSLNYQQHIDEVKKTDALTERIRIEQTSDSLKVIFPQLADFKDYSGEIHFYSPVAEKRDLTVALKLNAGFSQTVALKPLLKGRYQVKIEWMVSKVSYYQEEEISVGQ